MSGTLNSVYNNTSFALNLNAQAIGMLQEQISTGSRINRASDDPSTAYQILGLNSQKKSLENYINNITDISSILETSTSAIQDMASAISQTNASFNQLISGTYDETGRKRLADQINDTLEQMVSSANMQYSDQYLFGGGNTSSPPYTVQRTNGEITKVTYQGGSMQRNVEVAPGIRASAYCVGEDTFSSDNRTSPTFLGNTGATGGSGTSSVKGIGWLTVTYDGSHYNLSLDGGPVVDVGNVSDPTNVAVTNPDGKVLYVNASTISGIGINMVTVPGTCDIFNTLITVRDLLENKNGLSDTQLSVFRGGLSSSLNEVENLLVGKETSIGSKIGFLEDIKTSLENIKNNSEDQATTLQQADIAQLSVDLARRQTLYQMSLAAAAKLMSTSLLDYM